MSKLGWLRILDSQLRHVWTTAEDDDCGEGPQTVCVSPDWYAENGTPSCNCGRDMVYTHSEVFGTIKEIGYLRRFAHKLGGRIAAMVTKQAPTCTH